MRPPFGRGERGHMLGAYVHEELSWNDSLEPRVLHVRFG